jgi:hypothetical protein
MVYKFDLSVYETQLNNLNNLWIEQHRANNPQDTVTQRYTDGTVFFVFGYIVKDAVTEQYITDYLEILEEVPRWHEEDKSIQIIQSNNDCLNMLEEYPEVGVFRKQNNIITYRENGFVYVYVNNLFPEHRALFLQFNSTINEK